VKTSEKRRIRTNLCRCIELVVTPGEVDLGVKESRDDKHGATWEIGTHAHKTRKQKDREQIRSDLRWRGRGALGLGALHWW
jgi:hypothetical protein